MALAVQADMVLYVAPDGNDAWSGTLERPNAGRTDGPLASLIGARDAIRKARAAGAAEPARVVVADGEYSVLEPLVLTPLDGGTADAPVLYEAAPGAKPIFSGGRRVTGFKVGADGIWRVRLPEVASGERYYEQLYVNGHWATRARSPNKFYDYVAAKVTQGIDPVTGQPADLTARGFIARPGVLMDWPNMNDVVLVLYHSWECSYLRMAGVDLAKNMGVTTAPTPWGFNQWGDNQRFHLENFIEALDAPDEWFLSRDGTLSYIPLEGEDPGTAEVYVPIATEFVRFEGEPSLGMPVEHITLRGLSFRHSAYTLPPEGHSDGQAEATVPAVVMLDGARNVALEDCEIGNAAIGGVWMRRGCRECRIERCNIHDFGANGVRIGETAVQPNDEDRTDHNIVDNNIIRTGARFFRGAHGVWIGNSGDNQVTHNDISDLYYTGISVGWVWGYGDSIAKRNTIDFNHIHHIGWGVLSDMGGVYTLGKSEGTTISNNVIHDVYSYDLYGRGGWGLYNDEGSTGIVLENNLVYNVKTGTYHQHYGEGNLVKNNIFCNSMDGQIQRSRVEEHLSFTYTNNIVYWQSGDLVAAGSLRDPNVIVESCLFYRADGQPVTVHGQSVADWQATGQGKGCIEADPMFVDAANNDFRLKPGSPAEKIGFVPFDFTQAGVYGSDEWKQLAASVTYPPVEFAPPPPPPPPLEIADDFELTPVGSPPAEAKVYVENKGDNIAVVDDFAAGGSHSLLLRDAPGLQSFFNPHMYYVPNHTQGRTTVSFDVRMGPGAILHHEWRDGSNPYKVGPSMWFRDGGLQIGGQQVVALPLDQWVHLEIASELGDASTGKWRVTVTLPDGTMKEFADLAIGTPDWRSLTWLGFCSMATEQTEIRLDDITVRNGEAG